MEIIMRCNLCGKSVCSFDWNEDMYDEDIDEDIWGHLQFKHPEEFEELQDWDTPEMIEEVYTKESD